jgi:hypothetical protein
VQLLFFKQGLEPLKEVPAWILESVAHIAVQKFVMGSPLYRQEQ